jgi:hypothetical protein
MVSPTLLPLSACAACYRRIVSSPWLCPRRNAWPALHRHFAGVVPKAVGRACRVAAIQGDTALVYCANGAAASRVRAQAKGVARALAQAGEPVAAVKVKVRADWSLPERPEKHDMPAAALAPSVNWKTPPRRGAQGRRGTAAGPAALGV